MIDQDGIMVSSDSYEYQRDAIELAELLKSGKVADWRPPGGLSTSRSSPFRLRYSGRCSDTARLAPNLYNLLCYATVLLWS